jgi:uncharacterized protein YndB with AHSA1/START domain
MKTNVGSTEVEAPEGRAETIMTRTFDAARDLVFEAHTSCEHVTRWWGPRRHSFAHCEMDFVEGGAWRYVLRNAEGGEEYPFRGEFREIRRPERLTWTFVFDTPPYNQHEAVETIVFSEEDGRTTITVTSVYPSVEIRDAVVASGMAEGADESWDRLEEYVGTLS